MNNFSDIFNFQTWKHFKYNLAEVAYFFKLWEGHLKKIEGHFGTGVLSYFLFLKWLFYINFPVFVFTFGFVILPQVLYRYMVQEPCCYTQNVTFTGKELLTGSVSIAGLSHPFLGMGLGPMELGKLAWF